jgi:hypothetical protein
MLQLYVECPTKAHVLRSWAPPLGTVGEWQNLKRRGLVEGLPVIGVRPLKERVGLQLFLPPHFQIIKSAALLLQALPAMLFCLTTDPKQQGQSVME